MGKAEERDWLGEPGFCEESLRMMAGGDAFLCRPLFFCSKIGKCYQLIPRPSEKSKEVWAMYILEYKDGVKPDKLSPKAKANMERCANFLVEMIDKYGKEVLDEIEAEERSETGWDQEIKHDGE